jgi:CBS domain-containing protein
MSVDTIMHKDLVVIAPDETVVTAVRRMREHNLGAVLVVDDGTLVGIFSERDLLARVVCEALDPASTRVGEVATPNPVTVSASTPVRECYELFKAKGFRHLPIVDREGCPVGIISSRDLLACVTMHSEPLPDATYLFEEIGQLFIDIQQR